MKPSAKSFTLHELTKDLDVTIQGDPNVLITGVGPIQESLPGQITFLNNSLYKKHLSSTLASAIIISKELAPLCTGNAVITGNPYFTYAKVAAFFNDITPIKSGDIHPSVVAGEGCDIPASAVLSAGCVLGNRVKIGEHVVLQANVAIGDDVEIGEHTQIAANVSIYAKVKIGKRVHIASGAVIGSDGFGFAQHAGGWHKVPQLGSVIIGDDVDIGANTTIDRGAIENTIIEEGVKLDNLIQVAHNVFIGAHTIVAGCVAIAGSTIIGKHCMIGGGSCFAGHLSIADGVMITGMTAVTKSIPQPGIYSSGIVGAVPNHEFRKNNARFHRLENLMDKVKQLEIEIKQLKEAQHAL